MCFGTVKFGFRVITLMRCCPAAGPAAAVSCTAGTDRRLQSWSPPELLTSNSPVVDYPATDLSFQGQSNLAICLLLPAPRPETNPSSSRSPYWNAAGAAKPGRWRSLVLWGLQSCIHCGSSQAEATGRVAQRGRRFQACCCLCSKAST